MTTPPQVLNAESRRRRRLCTLLGGPWLLAGTTWPTASQARTQALQAPNVVVIGPRLVTAGQPAAAALAGLGQLGFEAVVYLAPFSVGDAVREEPALLARQGIEFVHIPIPFDAPTPAHREALSAALVRLAGRQVLVHCQINLRASTLVFLHRVIVERAEPQAAWDAVARVWTPQGPWRRLVQQQLGQHGIAFDPF